jgi:hydrogenase maturation protease
METIKIIGLGNGFAGDDAIGNIVARQLLPYQTPFISIMEGALSGLNLLEEMEGVDKLILIDAVSSQSETGTIYRLTIPRDLNAVEQLTWGSSTSSTHTFGLGEALTLATTLELLPQQVILYGIELGHIQQGGPLSPRMAQSIPFLIVRIVKEELQYLSCMNSN